MFRRKIKVKDNMFVKKIEEFLGTEIYQNPKKGELTPEELAAFRYALGEHMVNLFDPFLIERIGINDLFCPLYSVLTIKNDDNSYLRCNQISNYSNVVPLLNQRLIFFTTKKRVIKSIRVYIPSPDDNILHLNYLKPEFIDQHFDFKDVKFFVQNDGNIVNELNWSKEFFAFTNQKVEKSTIVLNYAP